MPEGGGGWLSLWTFERPVATVNGFKFPSSCNCDRPRHSGRGHPDVRSMKPHRSFVAMETKCYLEWDDLETGFEKHMLNLDNLSVLRHHMEGEGASAITEY